MILFISKRELVDIVATIVKAHVDEIEKRVGYLEFNRPYYENKVDALASFQDIIKSELFITDTVDRINRLQLKGKK